MENIISEINKVIAEHNEKGEKLKQEAAALRASKGQADNEPGSSKGKGKEKQREDSVALSDDSDDGLPKTPAGEEHRHKKQALTARLRENNIVMHRIHFLLGDVYHVLGESYEKQENESYAAAEDIRKKLLQSR